MRGLPQAIGAPYRSLLRIGLLCVCIVTLGVSPCDSQSSPRTDNVKLKAVVGGVEAMGLKGSGDELSSDDEVTIKKDSADMLQKNDGVLKDKGRKKKDEHEKAKSGNGLDWETIDFEQPGEFRELELDNPHPHISAPQLPFCKPTKTTLGSGKSANNDKDGTSNSRRGDRDRDHRSSKNHLDYDDLEVVSTEKGAVETDRKFLVATLDGKVTLLNRTGHQLWTVKTGPLFSSTISSLQLKENGKWINLIPSLTGGVYKYDGDSLYPMPFNADSLLKKSFKLSNDVVITGGKELRTFGIDINSGEIRYDCGISGCVMPTASDLNTSGKGPATDPVVLVVKKQMQTVRAIDSSTGAERWNFSVGTHELALAGVTEGCYHGEQRDSSVRLTDLLKIVIPEGKVFGADTKNHIMWNQEFEAPISQAWILDNGQLISVDPITNTPLPNVPSLYIGFHNQQFYVQESQTTSEKMERFLELESFGIESLKRKALTLAWKPRTRIDGISGSTALTTVHQNWVHFYPKPNSQPIYVYESDAMVDNALEGPNNTDLEDLEEESEEEFDDDPQDLDFGEGITQVIVMSLWFWWKEVLGISLLTAILLNLILMKPMMRAVRSETIREMTGYFQHLWNRWREEEETRALLARHSSNQLCIEPAENNDDPNIASIEENRKRSTSCSSTGSTNSPYGAPDDREIPFNSQYLNEFIPIACLGRGGFGVVFEAKKKIDDRTYAVKRITLPDREKARVRVMREVKALAQLDHRNIVRYFNAWIESPPPGWLEKNDPLWAKTLIGSPNPTMDYPSEIFPSSGPVESSRKFKPDHSKISLPPTPCDEHVCDEDSYIVFEPISTTSSVQGSSAEVLLPKPIDDQNDTSIRIPPSENASVASSVSSEGGGFFARRPMSLSIRSHISSFQEDNDELSQREAIVIDDNRKSSKPAESEKGIQALQDIMYLYIQQELCQKRTLQDWLLSTKSRELSSVIRIFSQIVEAVEYVHSKKLIHRDLKPSNIFLAEETENGRGVITVKVGDFGLATTAYAELDGETPVDERREMKPSEDERSGSAKVLTGRVGTHLYMSPEQYRRKPYDYKVDIYSLGLIFFELLVPFSTDMERYKNLMSVRNLNFPERFVESFPTELQLIRTMISHNPNERPDAAKITSWVRTHITSLSSSRGRGSSGSNDIFVERSVSSPAEVFINSDGANSYSGNQTIKARFLKTHSVM